MSIQQDICDTIGAEGLAVTALRAKMGNIGNNELDLAVRALMRGKRLRIVAVELTEGQYENHYELIPSKSPLGRMPNHPPPSAAEELAVNLRSPTRICITCARPPQPLCEFRLISRGERALVCNTCHGKKTAAGQPKHRGERAAISVNGSGNGQHGGSPAPSDSAPVSAAASSEVVFHSAQRTESGTPQGEAGDRAGPRVSPIERVQTVTHRDAVMNSPESGAEGSEVRDRNTSQRHGTGAVPQGGEAQATRHPAAPYDIDYSYSASFERPLIEYHDPVPVNVTLAPTVLERARAQREISLKRIAELEAELEKERKKAGECEVFFELYERFGAG